MTDINEQNQKLVQLAHLVFRTESGKELIKLLKEIYAFMPICSVGAPEGANYLRQGEVLFAYKLIRWATDDLENQSKSGDKLL